MGISVTPHSLNSPAEIDVKRSPSPHRAELFIPPLGFPALVPRVSWPFSGAMQFRPGFGRLLGWHLRGTFFIPFHPAPRMRPGSHSDSDSYSDSGTLAGSEKLFLKATETVCSERIALVNSASEFESLFSGSKVNNLQWLMLYMYNHFETRN
jgi:hypothetical protein